MAAEPSPHTCEALVGLETGSYSCLSQCEIRQMLYQLSYPGSACVIKVFVKVTVFFNLKGIHDEPPPCNSPLQLIVLIELILRTSDLVKSYTIQQDLH